MNHVQNPHDSTHHLYYTSRISRPLSYVFNILFKPTWYHFLLRLNYIHNSPFVSSVKKRAAIFDDSFFCQQQKENEEKK